MGFIVREGSNISGATKHLKKKFKDDSGVKFEEKPVDEIKGTFTKDQLRRLKKAREELK